MSSTRVALSDQVPTNPPSCSRFALHHSLLFLFFLVQPAVMTIFHITKVAPQTLCNMVPCIPADGGHSDGRSRTAVGGVGGAFRARNRFFHHPSTSTSFFVCANSQPAIFDQQLALFFYFRKTDERVCVPDPLNNKFQACVPTLLFKRWRESKSIFASYFGSNCGTYSSRTESAIGRAGVAALRSRVRPSAGPLEQRFRCLFFESFTLFSSVFSASS